MKFTFETEINSKLPFLDTVIENNGHSFTTSVYRKPTYTGLGLNFLSFCPKLYKINSVKTLINRAYNICSNFVQFDKEMKFLCNYFLQNAYPDHIFYRILRTFLDNKFTPPPTVSTVAKDTHYVTLPYLGHLSFTIRKELQNILREPFPQINFKFVFKNNHTIRSCLSKVKPLPFALRSNVVYYYNCSRCNSRYVGSTTRSLQHRILEHLGKSYRTGLPLSSPSSSAIRDHSLLSGHPLTQDSFQILTSASHRLDLLILESMLIKRMQPNLNNTLTAITLYTQ